MPSYIFYLEINLHTHTTCTYVRMDVRIIMSNSGGTLNKDVRRKAIQVAEHLRKKRLSSGEHKNEFKSNILFLVAIYVNFTCLT